MDRKRINGIPMKGKMDRKSQTKVNSRLALTTYPTI